jgi:hypothetical protein
VGLWFGVLTRRVLRRGEFRSVKELGQKILAYIEQYNAYRAHPYRWTYARKPLVV